MQLIVSHWKSDKHSCGHVELTKLENPQSSSIINNAKLPLLTLLLSWPDSRSRTLFTVASVWVVKRHYAMTRSGSCLEQREKESWETVLPWDAGERSTRDPGNSKESRRVWCYSLFAQHSIQEWISYILALLIARKLAIDTSDCFPGSACLNRWYVFSVVSWHIHF